MKPYIEYKGKTYEFEANFKLQKEFRKEYQKAIKEKSSSLIDEDVINELCELKDEAEKLKETINSQKINEEEQNKLLVKIISKYPSAKKLIEQDNEDELEEINEKYVRLMFEHKYPQEVKIFDEIIEQITEDNGINYVIQLFSSIIKTVFMSVVEETPHQKHSFIWETNKKN